MVLKEITEYPDETIATKDILDEPIVPQNTDGVVDMLKNLQVGKHTMFDICNFGHRTSFGKWIPESALEWALQNQWGLGKSKALIRKALQEGKMIKKNKKYSV